MPVVDLVVAHYAEDIRWTRNIPPAIRLRLYHKGGNPPPDSVSLPNIGREAHTYLYHIAKHYASLADLQVFCQGHPFDHAPDLHKRLQAWADQASHGPPFTWLGFLIETDDPRGRRCFVTWSKNESRRELAIDQFYPQVFGKPSPELLRFYGGAQFAVTRDAILRRPREFYERAMEIAAGFPDAAHCFERCWDAVFCEKGVDPSLLDTEGRAYLKPIRRLLNRG